MTKTTLLLLVFTTLFSGCFTTKSSTATITRMPAKFDFAPPSIEKARAAGMTIALINPTYINRTPDYFVAPFPEMAANMGNDFKELLTAKGFTLRTFDSRGKMTWNDKESCDFAFDVTIGLQPEYRRNAKYNEGWGALVPASYQMSGSITLGGNLIINAYSARYGELIWTKSIDLDKSTAAYTGSMKWDGQPTVAKELELDNAFYNTLARELEKFYNKAMELAWQQIDPVEMKTVADQAKKADKRN